jgi:hypothetical protein
MRTRSGKTHQPGTSRSHGNTTDPPPVPTVDAKLDALMNASADNARML